MAGDAAMQDGRFATPRSTLVECSQQVCVTLGGGKNNVQGQRFTQDVTVLASLSMENSRWLAPSSDCTERLRLDICTVVRRISGVICCMPLRAVE